LGAAHAEFPGGRKPPVLNGIYTQAEPEVETQSALKF